MYSSNNELVSKYNEIIKNRYTQIASYDVEDVKIPIEIVSCYNTDQTSVPFFSIVIPIHNQSEIIETNIRSIFKHTTEKTYELILILDSCSDNTEETIKNMLKNMLVAHSFPTLLTNVLVLKSMIPLFETTCDNLGFICSRGEYILEIQADMEMTESGYNMTLLTPFTIFSDIIGVSGRCCCDFRLIQGIGKVGESMGEPLSPNIQRGVFYVGETCNRGPLLLERFKLSQLGFLDEKNYFLDNSDHDLFARAYVQKTWICGYVPIELNSPLKNGSTRKPRDSVNQLRYDYKKSKCHGGFINDYLLTNPPLREIYAVPI